MQVFSLSCVQLLPLHCSLPGPSTAYGILQARIPEWVAISSFRGSSRPSDQTHGTCIGRRLGRDLGEALLSKCFPGSSVVKNLSANAGLIPGLGRSSGEGNSNPCQYSCLENCMDRGAWQAIVHGVVKELDLT